MQGSRTLVVDSYAWIEYFLGSDKGEKVLNELRKAKVTITPSVVLAELAHKYFREGMDRSSVEERIGLVRSVSIIRELDDPIVLGLRDSYNLLLDNTRRQGVKGKPALNDAIVLSTTLLADGFVITGDRHFKGLDRVIWIGD